MFTRFRLRPVKYPNLDTVKVGDTVEVIAKIEDKRPIQGVEPDVRR